MTAGFKQPIPFLRQMQRLNIGDWHREQILVNICGLLSIALDSLLRKLLLCVLDKEIAEQVRQSLSLTFAAEGRNRRFLVQKQIQAFLFQEPFFRKSL